MNYYEQLQQNILGTLINWPEEIDLAAELLKIEDFSLPMYQDVFGFLVQTQGADFVTLSKEFGKKYPIAEMVSWWDSVGTSAYLKRHCEDLKEENRKLDIYRTLAEVRRDFEGMSSFEMIEKIMSHISPLSVKSNEPMGAKTLVKNAIRSLEHRYENKGKLVGIPYGWYDLDKATNGLQRGDLVIIAGRPSMGKSVALLNIAESVCYNGNSALLFSLEMSKERLIERSLASVGGINFGRIRSGDFQPADWSKLMSASGQLHEYKFAIDDKPAITLPEIRAKARAMKNRQGLDMIGIDYLQLMGTSNNPSRTQAIGEISRGLKCLAKELDLTVIALSQLNRGVDNRSDKKPNMSDLRDSGEIEQDADVIIFPFREAAYCEKCRKKEDSPDHNLQWHQSQAEFIIAKQRDGEANISVEVAFQGRYQRFKSVEP